MLNNLNPVIAQAIAPFVAPPDVRQQTREAIEQIRSNIGMAAIRLREPGSPGEDNDTVVREIVALNAQIAELARYGNNCLSYDKLSNAARSWLNPLPAWATKGT